MGCGFGLEGIGIKNRGIEIPLPSDDVVDVWSIYLVIDSFAEEGCYFVNYWFDDVGVFGFEVEAE